MPPPPPSIWPQVAAARLPSRAISGTIAAGHADAALAALAAANLWPLLSAPTPAPAPAGFWSLRTPRCAPTCQLFRLPA